MAGRQSAAVTKALGLYDKRVRRRHITGFTKHQIITFSAYQAGCDPSSLYRAIKRRKHATIKSRKTR